MRTLALDIGAARIGVAVTDPTGRIATPVETVAARPPKDAAARIATLVDELGVGCVVVGWPVNLDGSAGHAVRRTQRFVDRLEAVLDVEIERWDERMTTAVAERALLEGDVRRKNRKQVIDQVAATLILQSWMQARAGRS